FPEHRQDILELLVALWEGWHPDAVFQPSLNDIHQDHQVIAAESMRAFKRTTILGYEIPWNNFDFAYQAYVSLQQAHVDRKVAALPRSAAGAGRPRARRRRGTGPSPSPCPATRRAFPAAALLRACTSRSALPAPVGRTRSPRSRLRR